MPNTPARRIEVDTMLSSKSLDLLVFLKVRCAGVLDVVVEGHDDLLWAVDLRGSHRHELEGDGPRVVVGHAIPGGKTDVVAAPNELAFGETNGITLYNLLRQCLRRALLGGSLGERN